MTVPLLRRGLVAAILLLTGACADPTGSARAVASISISDGSVALEEKTIGLGQSVQLTATPLDAAGDAVPGTAVQWSSSSPAHATVDGDGLVRGAQLGTAWVHARSQRVVDSVRVNVSEVLSGTVECDISQAPLTQAVGKVHLTSAYESSTLCVSGGDDGAEYLLVPFHASRVGGGDPGSRLDVEFRASGTASSFWNSAVDPVIARLARAEGRGADAGAPNERFHLAMRERALRELEPRLHALHRSPLPSTSLASSAATPAVGDILHLNVRTDSACAAPRNRASRVVAVSSRAIVVADTSNPQGGFSDQEYRAFATQFDQLVYPLGTETFGEPRDLDGNQRVIIFFTRAVNELTEAGSGSYVSGFFYDRDLFPRTGNGSCAGSNAAEILYLMVPDPVRAARGEGAFSRANVERRTVAVMGHELQHLINSSRRLYVNAAPVWEEVWLNEGLSHIMEELLFYRTTGLAPGANLDATMLSDPSHRAAFESFQLDNFERLLQYMNDPGSSSAMAGSGLPVRGASWSFLRYLTDRQGGSQRDFLYRLGNSTTSGVASLTHALGHSPAPWMHDWTTSLITDDAIATEARFQQPSWNYRSIVPASRRLLGQLSIGYPLAVTFLHSDETGIRSSIHSGGAIYLRFAVKPGEIAAIRTTSGGLRAPDKLKLAVVRVR